MKRSFSPTLLGVAALAAGALAQDASPPPDALTPSFPTRVEQVIVDVVVTRDKGEPVSGLGRDDFVVMEDGVPQTVESFEAVELPEEPPSTAVTPLPISTNAGPEGGRGRTFVILFDDLNLKPSRTRDAQAAVASFLENGVREGDSVTLISSAGGTWWTTRMVSGRDKLLGLVGRLEGRHIPDTSPERMSDWEAMRIEVYDDPIVSQRVYQRFATYGVLIHRANPSQVTPTIGSVDPFVANRANVVYAQARSRSRFTLSTLERALRGLVGAPGRKSVILVSEGFINDPNVQEFRKVDQAARRANAAVYFLDARGLQGMPDYYAAQFGPALPPEDMGSVFQDAHQAAGGSERIAEASGGFSIRNTNDLGAGIQRIADETRVYYLLGYTPTNTARDGLYREIEVELRDGKGLKVRARKGYYAPSAEEGSGTEPPPGVDPEFQAALDSPWSLDEIPIRMTAYVGAEKMMGKASVVVAAEVDPEALHFEEKEGRYVDAIQFVLVVAHRESGEFSRYDQTIDLDLRPETREQLKWLWFPITRDFALVPGDHQAKIVVREVSTGRLGSVVHDFEVPPLGEFRVSTPILSDRRRRSPGPGIEPEMLARRDFLEGSPIMCRFDVFGAEKGENGMPRVAQGYEIRRADGSLYTRMAESVIEPTSIGAVSRLVTFSLRNATPGDYEMRLTFRDDLSGKTLELKEPFRVVSRQAATRRPPGQPGKRETSGAR
jgi:VWFA-related protein